MRQGRASFVVAVQLFEGPFPAIALIRDTKLQDGQSRRFGLLSQVFERTRKRQDRSEVRFSGEALSRFHFRIFSGFIAAEQLQDESVTGNSGKTFLVYWRTVYPAVRIKPFRAGEGTVPGSPRSTPYCRRSSRPPSIRFNKAVRTSSSRRPSYSMPFASNAETGDDYRVRGCLLNALALLPCAHRQGQEIAVLRVVLKRDRHHTQRGMEPFETSPIGDAC